MPDLLRLTLNSAQIQLLYNHILLSLMGKKCIFIHWNWIEWREKSLFICSKYSLERHKRVRLILLYINARFNSIESSENWIEKSIAPVRWTKGRRKRLQILTIRNHCPIIWSAFLFIDCCLTLFCCCRHRWRLPIPIYFYAILWKRFDFMMRIMCCVYTSWALLTVGSKPSSFRCTGNGYRLFLLYDFVVACPARYFLFRRSSCNTRVTSDSCIHTQHTFSAIYKQRALMLTKLNT